MFEIDECNIPIVRTRQALLLLDLQNDFISTGGLLPVEEPANFVNNILTLLPRFRNSGNNVIWIRSQFETSRSVNDNRRNSETVITDDQLKPPHRKGGRRKGASTRKPSQKLLDQHSRIALSNSQEIEDGRLHGEDGAEADEVDDKFAIDETFLTLPPGHLPRVVAPGSSGTAFSQRAYVGADEASDLFYCKSYYSAFKDGKLVQLMRARFITEIFICGSLTNISVFATAMDAARHGYTITILEDCLGYRSKERHEEALRQLTQQTGCDIISSKELMEDLERKEKARSKSAPKTPQRDSKGGSLEALMARMTIRRRDDSRHGAIDEPVNEIVAPEVKASESLKTVRIITKEVEAPRKRERVPTRIKTRRRRSKSKADDKGEPQSIILHQRSISPTSATLLGATEALEKISISTDVESKRTTTIVSSPQSISEESESSISTKSSETMDGTKPIAERPASSHSEEFFSVEDIPQVAEEVQKVIEKIEEEVEEAQPEVAGDELEGICEGDTSVITSLLPENEADGIFERLRDEIQWQKMLHQGGDVPRLVSVQGMVGKDGSIPIYRHPADESPPLRPFTKTVSLIQSRVEEALGHPVNHVLIQFYRDGSDYISEHSDKTLDIVPNSFIANVSLGAKRTMTFRTKRKPVAPDAKHLPPAPRQTVKAPLPHNSLCKVGLATNKKWLHAIRPDKRLESEKSPEELAFDGGRISLTFRHIGTFLNKDETKIWGQGAVSKSKEKASDVINGRTPEAEEMIHSFGKENQRSSEFDWDEVYGGGFDVLHVSNSRKLYLSGDKIADMSVKIQLAELNFDWVEGNLSPAFTWKSRNSVAPSSKNQTLKYVDNDLSRATVIGEQSIMFYLECVYAFGAKTPTHGDLARQFTRFDQCRTLLSRWRAVPYTAKPFLREMEIWEGYAAEHEFIASDKISVVDYAVFPILHEIYTERPDMAAGYDCLAELYQRLLARESIASLIEEEKVKGGK
ncbi:hypothetical protein HYFRA_00010159 [Hymenoscyphus fraxineus]|uniref:Fe2OG dioxygenase domain-containing protein n=1 Tax=Hymenoscyphus fraxineus TaxID=746836 RepID=A0A9N9KSK7_9HELO|nr:hypothetical protein HYFRA_00010159 [Hymenoscyphus fraxineus]